MTEKLKVREPIITLSEAEVLARMIRATVNNIDPDRRREYSHVKGSGKTRMESSDTSIFDDKTTTQLTHNLITSESGNKNKMMLIEHHPDGTQSRLEIEMRRGGMLRRNKATFNIEPEPELNEGEVLGFDHLTTFAVAMLANIVKPD